MGAAVGVDEAECPLVLKKDAYDAGSLNQLKGHEPGLDASGGSNRKTLRQRIIRFPVLFSSDPLHKE